MARVSVPVSDDTKQAVTEHPGDLGLDPALSEGQRYAALVEAGMAAKRAQVRRLRRDLSYAEHGADPQYAEVVAASTAAAFEPGGF